LQLVIAHFSHLIPPRKEILASRSERQELDPAPVVIDVQFVLPPESEATTVRRRST
jgi:hypothetical protein